MAKRKKEDCSDETNIALGHGGQPQRRRTRRNSWKCERNRKAFLENLAATCNVTLAAKMANLCAHGGYMLRLAEPAFREQWGRALAEGRERLRDLLHEHAAEALGAERVEGSVVSEKMREYGTKLALTLLKLHDPDAARERAALGGRKRPRSVEELRASILSKLEEAAAHLAAEGGSGPRLTAGEG
jgi:hypothetical protein